jgi:hypothetical protein
LDDLKSNAKNQLGDYKSVQMVKDDKYRILFEQGSVIATIRLNQGGRITAIGFDYPKKF